MKRMTFLVTVVFYLCGCNKELAQSNFEQVRLSTKAISSNMIEAQVTAYYDDLKTMICNTIALNSLDYPESYSDFTEDSTIANPLVAQLYYTDFEDFDTGESINFFNLSDDQKIAALDILLNQERCGLIDKVTTVPELIEEIECETLAMNYVIDKYTLERLHIPVTEITTYGESSISSEIQFIGVSDKHGGNFEDKPISDIVQPEILLQDYYDKYNEIVEERASNTSTSYYNIPATRVRTAWANKSKRGDFILALPVNGCPWIYTNLFNPWMVGHAGIINGNITTNSSLSALSTLECWTDDGVCEKSINTWSHKHYIMGLQKVKHRITRIFPDSATLSRRKVKHFLTIFDRRQVS